MKRLLILCLFILLLLCSCAGANPDFMPVASVNEVEALEDFSCSVAMNEKEVRLSSETAVQLYTMAYEACVSSETLIPDEADGDSFTLIFYTGGSDAPADSSPYLQPDVIYYGYFVIGADDTAQYSEHVLVSHTTYFQLKEGTYEKIRALVDQATAS